MNKSQIASLSNVALLAHFATMEGQIVKEVNMHGITKKTLKEWRYTVHEVAKRFEVNVLELTSLMDSEKLLEATV
jgi:hypothetical protein